MKTILDEIKWRGEALVDKARRGESLTKEESETLKIYMSLYSGTNPQAGKRVVKERKARNR